VVLAATKNMLLLLLGFLIRLRKRKGASNGHPKSSLTVGQFTEPQKGYSFMSTIQDVSAEQLAKVFHHYREALAHGSEGREGEEGSSSWDRASENERKLMVAAARLALLELTTTPAEAIPGRRYFAKPGEAEWGC
jgi:hypothetical protein